jgi:hypothetical protein
MTMLPAADTVDLYDATQAIADDGRGLMRQLLPQGEVPERWRHYPPGDAVDAASGARYYYHSHEPGDRAADEHGHFHLFLARRALPRRTRPLIAPPGGTRPRLSTVHIAALSIGHDGMPLRWLATNRWVTGEYLYAAEAIAPLLERFSLAQADGPPLLDRWLAALVRASAQRLTDLLVERDAMLMATGLDGEDRSIEVVAETPVALGDLPG